MIAADRLLVFNDFLLILGVDYVVTISIQTISIFVNTITPDVQSITFGILRNGLGCVIAGFSIHGDLHGRTEAIHGAIIVGRIIAVDIVSVQATQGVVDILSGTILCLSTTNGSTFLNPLTIAVLDSTGMSEAHEAVFIVDIRRRDYHNGGIFVQLLIILGIFNQEADGLSSAHVHRLGGITNLITISADFAIGSIISSLCADNVTIGGLRSGLHAEG